MDILVFGIGKFYKNREYLLKSFNDNILAYVDNNAENNRIFCDKMVYLPTEIVNRDYDIILLMSIYFESMRIQLLALGVDERKIITWEKYFCYKKHGESRLYIKNLDINLEYKKRILIVTTNLNYNGGSLVAVYAALLLKKLNYDVTLATSNVDKIFLKEVIEKGIRVIVVPSLPYVGIEELDRIRLYDLVIVNVFQMLKVAYEVSNYKPVLWWIHEPSSKFSKIYKETIDMFSNEDENIVNRSLYICSVSEIAKRNFEYYHPGMIKEILPYGIPDESKFRRNVKEEIVFALIGPVVELKGQVVFVNAATKLIKIFGNKLNFMVIGAPFVGTDYYKCFAEMINDISQIEFMGELSRNELNERFAVIDVVVCASLEETMSLTITEGMMHGKICITTDATGIADYITDGVNGFVCAAGDALSLSEKMQYVIEHYDEMDKVREAARKTYEEYFSLEKFGDRLEKAILNAENYYYNS